MRCAVKIYWELELTYDSGYSLQNMQLQELGRCHTCDFSRNFIERQNRGMELWALIFPGSLRSWSRPVELKLPETVTKQLYWHA